MSFGISGNEETTEMIGGDVVVAWIDKETLKGYAEDYYLQDKAQCSGPKGSCPDERFEANTNNIRLLNAAMVNGYSIVTYQRPLKPSDQYDKRIYTNKTQAIIWAIGPLNQRNEVSFHSKYTKGDRLIEFGRAAKWNCPKPTNGQPSMQEAPTESESEPIDQPATPDPSVRSRTDQRKRGPVRKEISEETPAPEHKPARIRIRSRDRVQAKESNDSPRQVPTPAPVAKREPWEIPPIQCHEPEDGVFYAQMGPTGGKRGYPAITGHVGWGISWYINGLLIPEINVVRGKTYTFIVEGGVDPEVSAKYHPFYITDDPVGGYAYKTPEEKANIKIFAGAKEGTDGEVSPTGTGRLCHWTHQGDSEAEDFESFGAYQRTLELKCDQGEPGIVQWTPDRNTPDTVYYQCFTHRYLGWKINVLNACDTEPAASEQKPTFALPDNLEGSQSIRVESRVPSPNNIVSSNDKEENADGEIPQTIISNSFTQPLVQLQTDIPFFLQPPSNYFSQPMYLQSPPPIPGTFNPLAYSNLHLTNPHHNSFKPSPTLDTLPHEEKKIEIHAEEKQNLTTSSTAPPQIIEKSTTETIKSAQIEVKPSSNVHKIAPHKPPTVLVRTPITKHFAFSLNSQLRPPKSPPTFLSPPTYLLSPPPFKKPLNPPFLKASASNRPYSFTFPLPKFHGKPSPNRPQLVYLKKSPPLKKTPIIITTKSPKLEPHVEISPQQPATEREPAQTEEPTTPSSTKQYVQSTLPTLAVNTGFNPESVVIEGGFKPIISKEIQDRMIDVDDQLELEYESERGVIAIGPQTLQRFKPMFIPSPMDVKKMQKRRANENSVSKDEEVAAAERVDAYYLPPDNKKPLALSLMQSTNFQLPPGIVVTYDGRTVPGASLSAMPPQIATMENNNPSKTSDLIKSSPQFKPYGGDWPPLDPKFITSNAPILHYQGLSNRRIPSTSYTKLTLVRPLVGEETDDLADEDKERTRRKREAHHTPEHTAEQMRDSNHHDHHTHDDKPPPENSSETVRFSTFTLFISILALNLFKLI